MPSAITKIGILNRAAQLLGQPSITSLNENSRTAKALLRCYDSIFLAELEGHTWGCSIRRANLAADPTSPVNGKTKYFALPGDFLFLAPEETTFTNPRRRDYDIETFNNSLCIVTSLPAPLAIRYVASSITESSFSATFAEALSHALAMATCEEITNSNTKMQNIERGYEKTIARAKKRNDVQKGPTKSPTCSWISVRQ